MESHPMFALCAAHYGMRWYIYYIQFPYLETDDLPPEVLSLFYRCYCATVLIERACVRASVANEHWSDKFMLMAIDIVPHKRYCRRLACMGHMVR